MVGDGINDSAALAQADLSVAMGRGSDIAIETSMLTILSSDLMRLPQAIRLSHQTVSTIRQNLFWAFFYNVISVPIAAGILYLSAVSCSAHDCRCSHGLQQCQRSDQLVAQCQTEL